MKYRRLLYFLRIRCHKGVIHIEHVSFSRGSSHSISWQPNHDIILKTWTGDNFVSIASMLFRSGVSVQMNISETAATGIANARIHGTIRDVKLGLNRTVEAVRRAGTGRHNPGVTGIGRHISFSCEPGFPPPVALANATAENLREIWSQFYGPRPANQSLSFWRRNGRSASGTVLRSLSAASNVASASSLRSVIETISLVTTEQPPVRPAIPRDRTLQPTLDTRVPNPCRAVS